MAKFIHGKYTNVNSPRIRLTWLLWPSVILPSIILPSYTNWGQSYLWKTLSNTWVKLPRKSYPCKVKVRRSFFLFIPCWEIIFSSFRQYIKNTTTTKNCRIYFLIMQQTNEGLHTFIASYDRYEAMEVNRDPLVYLVLLNVFRIGFQTFF